MLICAILLMLCFDATVMAAAAAATTTTKTTSHKVHNYLLLKIKIPHQNTNQPLHCSVPVAYWHVYFRFKQFYILRKNLAGITLVLKIPAYHSKSDQKA